MSNCLDESIRTLDARTDSIVYVQLLQQCGELRAYPQGRAVHCHLTRCGRDRETFVGNHLIQMYGKCGKLEEAIHVFQKINRPNVYSWNIVISAFLQNDQMNQARKMFDLSEQRDTCTWTTMVAAYAQTGNMLEAIRLFSRMPERDTVAWNAAAAAYSHIGDSKQTMKLLDLMSLEGVPCNRVTYSNAFAAFVKPSDLRDAVNLHSRMLVDEPGLDQDLATGNSLIGMYGRCGSAESAKRCFNEMPSRDVVSWTGLLTAYARNGYPVEALATFKLMDLEGVPANFVTFTSVIDACSRTGYLATGRLLHSYAIESGVAKNVEVATALINMYARCGSVDSAAEVFNEMPHKNVLTWSSIVAAYAQSGRCSRAMELFSAMNVEGEAPTDVTFTVLLTACTHAGLVGRGWRYFECMIVDFGIGASEGHYACMLDILARSGRLQETGELMVSIPFHIDYTEACAGSCKALLEQ